MDSRIVKKLKMARRDAGLTQRDVYERLGIKNTTLSAYETGLNEPSIDTFIRLCNLYNVNFADILGEVYGFPIQGNSLKIRSSEVSMVRDYRDLDEDGQDFVKSVLRREKNRTSLVKKQTISTPSVEEQTTQIHKGNFQQKVYDYYMSASAGTGVFMFDDTCGDKVTIASDVPGAKEADYLIKISGNSMEPDYFDGEVALVSKFSQVKVGDVGIFVIDGSAYIKEYAKTELVSRNPKAENVKVSEYSNIVCMGKVVGKTNEELLKRV